MNYSRSCRLWKNGKIPFAFDVKFGQFDTYKRDIFNEVIQQLEEESCIEFEDVTGINRREFPDYLL